MTSNGRGWGCWRSPKSDFIVERVQTIHLMSGEEVKKRPKLSEVIYGRPLRACEDQTKNRNNKFEND